MSFQYPSALYAVPIFLALIALSLRFARTRSFRSIISAIARCLTVTALLVALAGPHTETYKPAENLIAFLDISSSITPRQGDELLNRSRALAKDVRVPLSIIPFGKTIAPVALPLGPSDSYESIRRSWEKLDTGATNLETIIANPAAGSNPVALLLSDGYETSGAIRDRLSQSGARHLFPITAAGESKESAISISQLHAPLTVRAQRSVEIRATVTNSTSSPQPGQLEITHGDRVVYSRTVTIPATQDLTVTAQSDPAIEGLRTIQATFSWRDDSGPHSNTRTIWLTGEKRDKVLLLSGTPDDDRLLSKILQNQTYQLRSAITRDGFAEPESLADFRVIALNNVHRSELSERTINALVRYVRNGGGLVTIGGNRSYGLGGYIGSPIEEILPVRLVPPHQEKKRLTVAVQLVIDKSRSMATDARLEFAKMAAIEVVRSLRDDDFIGVIGFDDVPFIALPLSPLSRVRDSAVSRVNRLFPTNRTNLFPALDEARRGLAGVNAGRKHVIVLTDGKLPDPGPYYFELVKQMRFLGITVSTVMLGDDVDDGFLAAMAQLGGGAFYQTNDPSNLPKVFLSDVKVASGERTLREEPEIPVRLGPDTLISTNLRSFPPLRGFVQTLPREGASTELVVTDPEGTYPLLASWKSGNGRVVSYTSDANGRWSAPWMRWESVQEFWSDLVESARPRAVRENAQIPFDLRTWVEGDTLVADLSLFEDIGQRETRGRVVTPLGDTKDLLFTPVSRGHYQARVPKAMAGTYRASMFIGTDALPEVAWTLSGELFGEQSHRKPNLSLLSEIASRAGGKIDPAADDIRPWLRQVTESEDYSRHALWLALITLLAEILIRAIPLRKPLS